MDKLFCKHRTCPVGLCKFRFMKWFYENHEHLCTKYNITPVSKLIGYGKNGLVYKSSRDTAIKIGKNVFERETLFTLLDHNFKNVAKYHRMDLIDETEYFIVEMELLEKITQEDEDNIFGGQVFFYDKAPRDNDLWRQVFNGHMELKKLRIHNVDCHYENVMKCPKTNQIKIIDIMS